MLHIRVISMLPPTTGKHITDWISTIGKNQIKNLSVKSKTLKSRRKYTEKNIFKILLLGRSSQQQNLVT